GAEKILRHARLLAPQRDDVLAALGAVYRSGGRWREAAQIAAERAELADTAEARVARDCERIAHLRDGAGDLDAPRAAAREALSANAEAMPLWRKLLEVARKGGNAAEIAEVEAGIAELDARPPSPQALLARLAARIRDLRVRDHSLDDEAYRIVAELR